MRKWKRVETAEGTRFRSALDPHEAALLKSLVTSVLDMLEDRESSTPADELEELTGMRTGSSVPPEAETMKRLLPDFYRALHALVHAEFRAGKSKSLLSRAASHPWTLGRRHARAAVNVAYQSAKASLLQRRLSRLARLTAPAPPTPLIPLLTPQAASVPTDQASLK